MVVIWKKNINKTKLFINKTLHKMLMSKSPHKKKKKKKNKINPFKQKLKVYRAVLIKNKPLFMRKQKN